MRSRHRPVSTLVVVCLVVVLRLAAARAETPPTADATPVIEAPTYADACQVDFSFLRSPQPHGFLRVGPNGTFVWKDGSRARFWGVNIANRNLWIGRAEIDRVVELLARAGTNLVRFEALDSRGGLLDNDGAPGTRRLNPERLDLLHYWIMRCKEARICYYLDLLDFREFKPEDGVEAPLNRGARPYAMFDPHLLALQKEYATALLTTRNPYTGLAPVEDPDLALLEICNEHGFFLNPALIGQMVEPYRGRFREMWNTWLKARYADRARLEAAWKQRLGAGEDALTGTVALPTLEDPSGKRGPRTVDGRLADEVAFLHDVQRRYFKEMMAHLRSIGVRIPVTAVVSNDVAPDLASVAAECDFLSENFYADHPRFDGREWEGKYRFRNLNPLREAGPGGFAPFTAALRWYGKPVVIREWGTVWPNRYRAGSVPQAVAYGCLQDYDAMILFGYKTGENASRLVFFGYQADPTVWGLYSLGAAMFLRGDVAPSSAQITFVYTLATMLAFPNGVTDAHRLAWLLRVNAETDTESPVLPDVKTPRSLTRTLEAGRLLLRVAAQPSGVVEMLSSLGFTLWSARQRLQRGIYESSTSQITLDTRAGLLRVGAPNACLAAGEIDAAEGISAGALNVRTATPVGAVVAVSLDGLPLTRSRRYIIKMVSVAENTGQTLTPATSADGTPDHVLTEEGGGPVRTLGAPSDLGTRVAIDGRPVLSVGMVNGTWELYVDGSRARFACDTPHIPVVVLGRRMVTVRAEGRL